MKLYLMMLVVVVLKEFDRTGLFGQLMFFVLLSVAL